MNDDQQPRPLCFVVSPIGDPNSATRKRSNGYLREVIQPVATGFGFRVERADHDKAPGVVTEAIVDKLVSAELVIVDLHGHNPNVMYEVAVRHATGKPIIQMIEEGESLPFDIGGLNTIFYDSSVDGLRSWREDLSDAIEAVKDGDDTENPVSRASMFRALRTSPVDQERVLSTILRSVEQLRSEVSAGRGDRRPSGARSRVLLLPDKYVESEIVSFLQQHPAFEPFNFLVDCKDQKLRVGVYSKKLEGPAVGSFVYEFDWDEKGRIAVTDLKSRLIADIANLPEETADEGSGAEKGG